MNTIETKMKFFAQYYGQDVLTAGNANCDNLPENWLADDLQHSQYLLLTPLSTTSDEDAVTIAKASGMFKTNLHFDVYEIETHGGVKLKAVSTFGGDIGNRFVICEDMPSDCVDKSRELGYAHKWNGITQEQQIEYGWITLKD